MEKDRAHLRIGVGRGERRGKLLVHPGRQRVLLLRPSELDRRDAVLDFRLDAHVRGRRYSLNFSRSVSFDSLPVAVCGSSATNTTSSGIHHFAILPS